MWSGTGSRMIFGGTSEEEEDGGRGRIEGGGTIRRDVYSGRGRRSLRLERVVGCDSRPVTEVRSVGPWTPKGVRESTERRKFPVRRYLLSF